MARPQIMYQSLCEYGSLLDPLGMALGANSGGKKPRAQRARITKRERVALCTFSAKPSIIMPCSPRGRPRVEVMAGAEKSTILPESP